MADILSKMGPKRIFAAVDLSEEARRAAADYADSLRRAFPNVKVRWERPEKYHITLRFEAAADAAILAEMERLVTEAASTRAPFELELGGTGAFENRRGPAVLWLGLRSAGQADPNALTDLARKLSYNDKRRFSPHLTIARIKHAETARQLIDVHTSNIFPPQLFTVTDLKLYESTLSPTGSTYSVLLNANLTG